MVLLHVPHPQHQNKGQWCQRQRLGRTIYFDASEMGWSRQRQHQTWQNSVAWSGWILYNKALPESGNIVLANPWEGLNFVDCPKLSGNNGCGNNSSYDSNGTGLGCVDRIASAFLDAPSNSNSGEMTYLHKSYVVHGLWHQSSAASTRIWVWHCYLGTHSRGTSARRCTVTVGGDWKSRGRRAAVLVKAPQTVVKYTIQNNS